MIFTTYCQQASGIDWTDTANIIGDTSTTYTTLPASWSTGSLRLWDFDGLVDQFRNPKSTITSIDVTFSLESSTTADSTTLLKAGLSYDGTTLVTEEKFIPAGYQSTTDVVLTFTCDITGFLINRYDLRTENFSVLVRPHTDLNNEIKLRNVKVEINYDQQNILLGETSSFPTTRDTLVTVTDSSEPLVDDDSYVIRSELMNNLGDAIIKVQRLATLDAEVLNDLGPGLLKVGFQGDVSSGLRQDMYLLTCVVSGVSIPENFYSAYFERQQTSGNTYFVNDVFAESSRFSSGFYSTVLNPSALTAEDGVTFKTLIADFVSTTGWVVSGSTKIPVHATGYGMFFLDWDNSTSYYKNKIIGHCMGFRFMPLVPGTGFTSTITTGAAPALPNLTLSRGALYSSGSENFEVRITAILREQTPPEAII